MNFDYCDRLLLADALDFKIGDIRAEVERQYMECTAADPDLAHQLEIFEELRGRLKV